MFTETTIFINGHIIIIKFYLVKILIERIIFMAKTNPTPIPVTENNEQEKFMLYPTKLFNDEKNAVDFEQDSSAIASRAYMRGLVMEICDEFKRPVVLLQKKYLNDGDECKNCKNDKNTDFCCSGNFSRLESALFYDHWAMLCKRIRKNKGKPTCCKQDEGVAEFLLNNIKTLKPGKTDINIGNEVITAEITRDNGDIPHVCVRYECPISHYDEIAVNINVNGIEGVMIIGQLLFDTEDNERKERFNNIVSSYYDDSEEEKSKLAYEKAKNENGLSKVIHDIFTCVKELEKALLKEYEYRIDNNAKTLQEKMIKNFNAHYQKNEEIEKENIDEVKKCEEKYEQLKVVFLSSLNVFCDATDIVTELYYSVPDGLYFNSKNVTGRIKTNIIQDYKQFFEKSPVIEKDEFVKICNGYYEFCKKLDVTEEKYVRIIINRKDKTIDKIFSGFLQFVSLYITELFAQYNGMLISEYTTMMRHEMGQLNEAILIRINTFQEAIGKQKEDDYTYAFITECNHIIDDYKSHAHSTMLRCNSSRYFTKLPDIHKEPFYPYESFLYKWKYIYEKAAKNKQVNFLMEPVMLSDLTRPRMYADKAMIEQVAYNLTNNAIKYSIPGTTISIDCKLNDRKDAYQLIVTNYGRAIREDEIDKIFDYGFRGSNHNNANGSGLGLYLSREIAKEHGGRLTVETEKISDYDVSCLYLYSEMPDRFQSPEIRDDIKKELFRLKETKYSAEIEKPQFNNQSFTPYLIRQYLNTGTLKYKFILAIPYDKKSR